MKKLACVALGALTVLTGVLVNVPSSSAEGLPDLGDNSQNELSPQMEKRIGEEAINDIRLHEPSYMDDAEIAGYLNRLVARLALQIEGPRQYFEVFALRDATLNAFAMPGGYIGVHSGLILAAQSESELAGVLSHEISHVTQHHLARSIAPAQAGQTATLVAMAVALLAARNRPDLATGAVMGAQAAYVQNQLGYSRDFEREADRIGVQLLDRSGFDTRGMASFFERLERATRIQEGNAPSYLRTHPLTTERISDMENRVQGLRYRQVADSLDFQMVRAKLRAEEGTPDEAIRYMASLIADKKYASEGVARYGLARAYLRAEKIKEADQELGNVRRLKLVSPMVETLAASVAEKKQDYEGAIRLLRAAQKTYPSDRAIQYQLGDTYLKAGKPSEAVQLASQELQNYTTDARLYLMLAKAYAAQGYEFRQHRAQGEAYLRQGQLDAALEQFNIAQKATDGDFYEHSQVDAKVRDLKTRIEQREKENRR